MDEKEFNLAILKELIKIAGKVFAKVTVSKEGTYTAAELWNEKNAFGESIVIDYKGTESEIYTAEIGTFKMQVTPQKLWYALWKFERLCNVKQADKMRFTHGKQEGENISEKAMYLDKSGKEVTRKKSLVKLSERVAVEPDKKTKSYNMYYFVAGLWYLIAQNFDERQYKAIQERIDKDDNYLFGLLQRWDFNTENRLNPIYKALFEALKSERVNNTLEERKFENEAENAVICDVVAGKNECGSLHVEQTEVKEIGNGLYKDSDNLYFEHGKYLYILGGYTRGVATFLKHQTDIKAKIVSMIEEGGISTESAKILYEKLTGHKFGEPAKVEPTQEEAHEVILTYFSVVVDGDAFEIRIKPEKLDEPYRFECTFAECVAKMRHTNPDVRDAAKEEIANRIYNCAYDYLRKERGLVRVIQICNEAVKEFIRINGIGKEDEEAQEDYPPEPYNKEKSENVASLATIKTRNVATSYERFQDRTICGRFQKNMCPNYLRQKVLPTESFQPRRKIRRFKLLSFAGYISYHSRKESALERKRNGNTRVYRTLIRGETKNNNLTCRQTCLCL